MRYQYLSTFHASELSIYALRTVLERMGYVSMSLAWILYYENRIMTRMRTFALRQQHHMQRFSRASSTSTHVYISLT